MDANYIKKLNDYLFSCYRTTAHVHELFLANENKRQGIGPAECAEIIYTLRIIPKKTEVFHASSK